MANPRKFSEKIALHNQKQAEETAAFERIMQEVSVTRQPQQTRLLNPHSQVFLRPSSLLGGSLPNVNQMSAGPPIEIPMRPGPYDEFKPPHYRHQRFDTRPRPYNMHRRPDFPNRHPRHIEGVPGGSYTGPYLSPPADSSWRSFALSRTNSDSALHQSVMNPNSQETFSSFGNPPSHPAMPPPGRDLMDMTIPKMSPLDADKLHQQFASVTNRPKSCEDTQMNVLPNTELPGTNVNHRQGLPPNPTNPGLTHVAQIGNNTGSLPDLTNLHIPSPLSNPIDYEEQQKQIPQNHQPGNTLQSPGSMLYNQARSTGNLAAASAMNAHIGGLSPRGNPASPNRLRRHTHNGPSPLITSPDQNRRMKYHGVTSPKMGIKPDLKSPPIGGPYYPYPPPPGQGPLHQQMRQHLQHTSSTAHPVLRVDVNAASKVGQYASPHHPQQIGGHRHSTGPNMTSPITSPTSPTSRSSLSPGASPQHLPEMTTTTNPALSEAYYRTDPTSVQPLQHQFEHFHVVNDSSTAGIPHPSMPPPVYSSNLQLLGDASFPQNSTFGMPTQRSSDSSIYTYNNGSNSLLYKSPISPTAKIPDIVFTGVDDGQSKSLAGGGEAPAYPGTSSLSGTDFGTDYFPGDDLKCNLGLEELQMLAQDKLIEDPAMEDELR